MRDDARHSLAGSDANTGCARPLNGRSGRSIVETTCTKFSARINTLNNKNDPIYGLIHSLRGEAWLWLTSCSEAKSQIIYRDISGVTFRLRLTLIPKNSPKSDRDEGSL